MLDPYIDFPIKLAICYYIGMFWLLLLDIFGTILSGDFYIGRKLLFLYDSYIELIEEDGDDLLDFNIIYSKFKKGLIEDEWG